VPVYIIVGTIDKKESIFILKRTRDNRDNVAEVPVFRGFPCHGVTTPPVFLPTTVTSARLPGLSRSPPGLLRAPRVVVRSFAMTPIERSALRLVGVLAHNFPEGASGDELRAEFEADNSFPRATFHAALRYAKERRWVVFRFSGDRLVYWAQLQEAPPQENLLDEAEVDLSDGDINGVAVASLVRIVSDDTASMRQRLRAAAAVLGYKVKDAGAVELTRGFLESLCANAEIATDHRIAAGELLRKTEAPKVMSEIVRPDYREDGSGSEIERVEAWRSYLLKQRKWRLVKDTEATSLEPGAPYRLPPGWCDEFYRDDFVAPPGWPPWS
jgi:hypothetical protein